MIKTLILSGHFSLTSKIFLSIFHCKKLWIVDAFISLCLLILIVALPVGVTITTSSELYFESNNLINLLIIKVLPVPGDPVINERFELSATLIASFWSLWSLELLNFSNSSDGKLEIFLSLETIYSSISRIFEVVKYSLLLNKRMRLSLIKYLSASLKSKGVNFSTFLK